MRLLRAGWRVLRLVEHVLTGTLLTVLFSRRGPDGSYRCRSDIVRWWHERACGILGLVIERVGDPPSDSALLVANHVSWLDVPVLGGLGTIAFLSKAEVRDWPFCLAFCFFRLAAILQGVKKRALDGNASSTKALEYGAYTASLAAMGVGIVEGSGE